MLRWQQNASTVQNSSRFYEVGSSVSLSVNTHNNHSERRQKMWMLVNTTNMIIINISNEFPQISTVHFCFLFIDNADDDVCHKVQ